VPDLSLFDEFLDGSRDIFDRDTIYAAPLAAHLLPDSAGRLTLTSSSWSTSCARLPICCSGRWPPHTGGGNLRLWVRYVGSLLVRVCLVVLPERGLSVCHWRKKWCRTSAPSSVRWKVIRR
jgi:hypothetical protein